MSTSIRNQVAQNLADTCFFGGLTDGGISIEKSTTTPKSYWLVKFSVANIVGDIQVYSPKFITVRWWQNKTWNRKDRHGREVFHSEEAVKTFLIRNFVKD
jgi:hypothetical protein